MGKASQTVKVMYSNRMHTLSCKILGMLKFWCRNSSLDDWASQQSLKNFNATFRPSQASLYLFILYLFIYLFVFIVFIYLLFYLLFVVLYAWWSPWRPNVALQFLSDCWRARSSKDEFLQCTHLVLDTFSTHAISHGCFAVES